MSIAEKLATIAENQQKVYDAGYVKGKAQGGGVVIDPDKIIEKTVTGTTIRVDDVSEIPHKCTVSLDKDANVTVCGKNLLDKSQIVIGGLSGSNGADWNTNTQLRSGYIAVAPGQSYIVSGNTYKVNKIHYYDANKRWLTMNEGKTNFTTPENTRYVRLAFGNSGGTYTESDLAAIKAEPIQMEMGTTATAYEPYKGATTHTITAGQTIEVDSLCPTMTLFTDNDATITFGYHKSWGMQTEYDRFWDAIQQNGKRAHYTYAFAYTGWTEGIFNPKYPITPTNTSGIANMFFWNASVKDTKVPITVYGSASNAFSNSAIQRIPKLIFSDVTTVSNMFLNCTKLEELYCEGEIPLSISFAQSNLLTTASVQSIIDHLKDLTGQTAQTLTFHATVGGKLTAVQKAAVTAKNWTLVY